MKPTILILAAGMGSRYGGIKQLEPLGPSGETLMEYSLYDAIRAGFEKAVFLFRDDIIKEFEEKYQQLNQHIEVGYAFQDLNPKVRDNGNLLEYSTRQKPWGTAHAILSAASAIDTPFAVINADDFYGKNAYQVMADFLAGTAKEDHTYAVVGYPIENTLSPNGTVSRATIDRDSQGLLTHVVERTSIGMRSGTIKYQEQDTLYPIEVGTLVSMNFWGFTPTLFKALNDQFTEFVKHNSHNPKAEFYIPTVVNQMVSDGEARVEVLNCHDQWMGVTYREDKQTVVDNIKQLVENGIYPASLWG